ncbi:MAG: prolyl oligopeptidase family serine peptidase [Candidatus Sabulitectum sp.]|nr:prolyl oligopeptidase family serine peptidase [Candidatus Sabulitectum sp.]
MKQIIASMFFAAILLASPEDGELNYPQTSVSDHVDSLFGTQVADPYRWLEEIDGEETIEWIEAQRDFTEAYLSGIPNRELIRERLRGITEYTRRSMPTVKGERYFFSQIEEDQDFSVYYYHDGLDQEPIPFLDFNEFPEESNLSQGGISYSRDGELAAWGARESGSDWITLRIRDVSSATDLDDIILWTKHPMVAWNSDNTGFYYIRYPALEEGEEHTALSTGNMIWFHRLGTQQSEDSLVYERPDKPEWYLSCGMAHDQRYLLIYAGDGASLHKNGLFYIDLQDENGEVVELLNDFDAYYYPIENIEEEFFIETNLDAPNGKVFSINLSNPERENWQTIIPESDCVLQSVSLVNQNTLALVYSEDAVSRVQLNTVTGEFIKNIELPCPGSTSGFRGELDCSLAFYSFSSFLHPGEIYMYNFDTGEAELYWEPETGMDLDQFQSKQVFYESNDGTRIPMFLVYPRDITLDGSNPVLLSGYGGFGVSMTPSFNAVNLVWAEMGGIFALPCLRGGGEYGEEWHLAGIREKRDNVFNDFISAAEYLIQEGYTSCEKLAVIGGSNGGTLVGACLNRRPDLFGAALPAVGVMDLLRFHLSTVAWLWIPEYGDPESEKDFEFLYRFSPYHNIEDGTEYPAVMVTTADHDDRVVPWHSFKYGARLQAAQAGSAPVLINILESAGHGGGAGLSRYLSRRADEYAFLGRALGMKEFGTE